MKFLIVDDDQDILNISGKLLKLQGHEVVESNSALEAIQLLGDLSFDLLITDATMPAHSGFDLIRSIGKNKELGYLTIAMLTGRREESDIKQAVQLGVQDYIVKPIDPQLFLNKVANLVEKHENKMKNWKHSRGPMAKLIMDVKLQRITDVGITVESSIFFPPGSTVELEVKELNESGIKKTKFRTLFSKQIVGSNLFNSEFLILDLDSNEKNQMEKIARSWLFKKSA